MRRADPQLHQQRRLQILEGAERCFRSKGFHQASMQDIANESGVSMGLLYRYFANKEAIVVSFADSDSAELVSLLAEFAASSSPLELWPGILRRMLKEASEPDYVRITTEVFAEALRNPKLFESLVQSDDTVRRALIDAIKAQQSAGRMVAQLDPIVAADILMGMIDGVGLRACLVRQFKPRAIERHIQDLVRPWFVAPA
ncbi:TetR/AcrR family transcriptional regulator [Tahibacter amnicola]|uniref:TetR/AcrR family transcriptional regulator n=1 Tax=Tahibacter amnicola TaxID=2976241 RepID=A0ABY6BJ51_9GAMM|nr:TetR/AcrR family transcriptional regulator [Tahibacter amnicola]UXI69870.1 TetR/AcrR family transcriptional regulator [Tahibacter amnicola]